MADQVVLMRAGRIEQDAAPAELYERPATIFAARFVGTPPMNVLPAALVARSVARRSAAGRAREALAIGVRPEAARLAADGVPATVAAVEYLGADTLIDTRIGGRSRSSCASPAAPTVDAGDDASASRWDAGRRALVRCCHRQRRIDR